MRKALYEQEFIKADEPDHCPIQRLVSWPKCLEMFCCQAIQTSIELAREVQRITVDASANISEVQQITVASMDPSSLSGYFALRHGYYISPSVPFNATADEVRLNLLFHRYLMPRQASPRQLQHQQPQQKPMQQPRHHLPPPTASSTTTTTSTTSLSHAPHTPVPQTRRICRFKKP